MQPMPSVAPSVGGVDALVEAAQPHKPDRAGERQLGPEQQQRDRRRRPKRAVRRVGRSITSPRMTKFASVAIATKPSSAMTSADSKQCAPPARMPKTSGSIAAST
jgi:hypothetical protein